MNSIEPVSNPEKKGPQPDSPTLRVFVKEGNAYALQSETKDYGQAIKQAEKHQEKGKDVLVNEKDNPNIVHVKTNRALDVDIGREIKPSHTQGLPVKGPGEIVLASFYTKLPMDTKAFDDRAAKDVKADPAPVGRDTVKEPTKATIDSAGRDAVKEPGKAAAEPVGRDSAKEPVKGKEAPEAVAIGAKDAKAVLDKTGYALPDSVKGEYTVKDGKFHDRDSSALRFEDHGKKLSTPVEDRKVIAHMVEVAAAKNWGTLELKGTDNFKQIAWLEAQARGVETKGYKPNERDLEELAKVKQERGIPEKQVAAPAAPVKSNEIIAAGPSQSKDAPDPAKGKDAPGDKAAGRTLTPDEQMRVGVATKLMEKQLAKLPEAARMQAIDKMTAAVKDGTLKLPTPKVTERAIDRPAPAPAPAMDRSR